MTVQLANDQTGANANVAVPLNDPCAVDALWAGTSVASGKWGHVHASSTQLVAFKQTSKCVFWDWEGTVAEVDAQRTWSWLADGKVRDLKGVWVKCSE